MVSIIAYQPKEINILSPVGGIYNKGDSVEVTWTTTGTFEIDTLVIDLHLNGEFLTNLGEFANSGSYWFYISSSFDSSDQYQIVIYDIADSNVVDISNTFEIKATSTPSSNNTPPESSTTPPNPNDPSNNNIGLPINPFYAILLPLFLLIGFRINHNFHSKRKEYQF